MTEVEFATATGKLLAACSPEQRAKLIEAARSYGASAEGGAMDSASSVYPPFDEMFRRDPDNGKSLEERFPGLNRLKG